MKAKDIASKHFWKSMPPGSMLLFLAAVFLIFAPVGFLMDIWQGGKLSIERVGLSVIYSGLVSIGYAYSFTRDFRVLPFTIIFQFGFHFIPWAAYFPAGPAAAAEIQNRLIFDGIGIMICIILAYVVFINFATTEGSKHIALAKEMELAGEIHRVLVPDIKVNNERFEIWGKSIPAEEVGGDLIDYIDNADKTLVYMIDVSGHGVGPGLLTGMFKAAFRSVYSHTESLQGIINHINTILLDQKKKGMFITFGGILFDSDQNAEILFAGHPPVIRIDTHGELKKIDTASQLPLLTIKGTIYKSVKIKVDPGDLFIIYSDGITETSNKKNEEFGLNRLRVTLQKIWQAETNQISEEIFTALEHFGMRTDDQSLIVTRLK